MGGSHQVLGRELSELLSAYFICVWRNSPSLPLRELSLPKQYSRNMMCCTKGIFAEGIWGCPPFSLLRWGKGSETPFCDGEKGLRLPRSSCSDLGNEGVLHPFPQRKRESQTLFPTARGKPRTSRNPLSENPLSATHQNMPVSCSGQKNRASKIDHAFVWVPAAIFVIFVVLG